MSDGVDWENTALVFFDVIIHTKILPNNVLYWFLVRASRRRYTLEYTYMRSLRDGCSGTSCRLPEAVFARLPFFSQALHVLVSHLMFLKLLV